MRISAPLILLFWTKLIFSQIIINEINYRSASNDVYTEYIELYNNSVSSVNISGWILEQGVNYEFPIGTSISGSSYLIIASNTSDFNAEYTNVGGAQVLGDWVGSLKNSGEDIVLRDNNYAIIDHVDYDNWNEWPSTNHNDLNPLSIQKINYNLPGKHGGSWRAAAHTPGTFNGAVYNNSPAQTPIIKDVRKSPDKPLSTEDVTISAEFDFDNLLGINGLSVILEYQRVQPGSYLKFSNAAYSNANNWTPITMRDNGVLPDVNPNNGVFTAKIPASIHDHRDLIRYRIKISNSSGFSQTLPDQNYRERNYAYYVYDGYPTHNGYDLTTLPVLQDFTLITTEIDTKVNVGDAAGNETNNSAIQYQGYDYQGEGTIVYNGRVYDHIKFRPRGGDSRPRRDKPNLKFDLNRPHSFETQNDCGKTYDVDRGKLILSGGWVNDEAGHGLTESIIYKILTLCGSIERAVNYSQFRIVNKTQQAGNGGDFWGLYLILEDYNGDLIDEHSLDEGNFWSTDRTTRDRELDYQGNFPNSGNISTYASPTTDNTASTRVWDIGSNFAGTTSTMVDMLLRDRVANVLYGQHGNNYIGKHSYREYYNSVTGEYLGWWGDMDNAFGAAQDGAEECQGNGIGGGQGCEDLEVFDRDICNPQRHIDNNMRVTSTHRVEYKNIMRSIYDLLVNGDHDGSDPSVDPFEQIDFLVDEQAKFIYTPGAANDWMEVDKNRWNQNYDLGSADAHVQWYKDWFHGRANYMKNNNSGSFDNTNDSDPNNEAILDILIDDDIQDSQIPNTPSIQKINQAAGFPVDQLTFSNSLFSDNTGGFGALQWRIAEWSDPTNPFYDTTCKSHHEIESVWESPIETSNLGSYTIPGDKIKPGRTYKVRMRHRDNTNRWSHWSDAVKFIAELPVLPPTSDIIITEIHYNPNIDCAEFIEIFNNGNNAIDLEGFRFDNGIDFTFPDVSISPGEYLVIVDDFSCFDATYSNAPTPVGNYSGALNNGGEVIELDNAFGELVDSVKYNDKLPWDTIPDLGVKSLALINVSLDNSFAANWSSQCVNTTPGQPNNFVTCNFETEDLSNLVINEIAYRPRNANGAFDQALEFIEVKNIGSTAVNILGATFSGAIDLRIEDYIVVPAGGFFIVAKDTFAFKNFHGIDAHAQYEGDLSNGGELIQLHDFFQNFIDEVAYTNSLPWDTDPANGFVSLALIDSNYENNTPSNWSDQDVPYTVMEENTFSGVSFSDYSDIEINEIFYYPPNSNSDLEFIEIKNTGSSLVALTDVSFQGVSYTFPAGKLIIPGGFLVIANDFDDFTTYFGFTPDGSWDGSGSLNNFGENLRLVDLFGNIIDQVNYSSSSPWDSGASNANRSLGLHLGGVDNSQAQNWSIQLPNYTPKAENIFDNDGDGIADTADQCPNLDDNLIGTSCNDGDPCTTGETYDTNCGCSGGSFQDSDNDGVCNANDNCPGFDNGLIGTSCNDGDICTVGEVYNSNCGCSGGVFLDSDNDGVCDSNDVCPGNDDNIDTNNNNIPDGCENCPNYIIDGNLVVINADQSANINIQTNGWVPSGTNITYQAGSSIDLKEQFEVKLGAIFEAKIDVCN